MEFNLMKTSIGTTVTCLDTVIEQPVDFDFTLPDYCPDIEKILRCKLTPKIYNRSINGGQLQIDGVTVITILYIDSQNNTLRTCEQSLPFNSSFQVKELPQNVIIDTNTKVEYVNCRALSQRRLSLHGAFSLYVKLNSIGYIDLFSPNDSENLEYNTSDINVSSLISLNQCLFSTGDDVSITNKPPIEVVLTSNVKVSVVDYKVISEKIIMNGELSVKLLYLSNTQEGKIEQVDCVIPFSQVLDCENINENAVVSLNLKVLSYDIHLKSEMLSENPVVSVDAKLSANVYGFEERTIPVINDAYSTEFVTKLENNPVGISNNIEVISDTFIQKEYLKLENQSILSVFDISNDFCIITPFNKDDNTYLNFKFNVCILAYDNNTPVYIEKIIDINKDINNYLLKNFLNLNAELQSISYRLSDENTLELRCEIKYSITHCGYESINVVENIKCDDKKIEKSDCALTLYYGKAGEKLWDIAKEYNTKLNLLYSENSIDCEVLENPQMLLIPTV